MASSLVIRFLLEDVKIGVLTPLHLTLHQIMVTSLVLTMYFRRLATSTLMVKELGIVEMLNSETIIVASVLMVVGPLNLILQALVGYLEQFPTPQNLTVLTFRRLLSIS